MSFSLSALFKGIVASGIGKKIAEGIGSFKEKISAGSAGASAAMASSVPGSSNPGFIKNWLHGGQIVGSGRIMYAVRFVILIAFFLAVLGIIGLTIGAESGQGIFTSLQNFVQTIFGGVKEGSQAYLLQYQLATGQRYATEVDTHADEEVGVNLAEISTTQASYGVNDPVILWGIIDAKVLKSEQPITVKIQCKNVKDSAEVGVDDIIEYGDILPSDQYTVFDTEAIDFRCQFQEGILDNEWSTTNKFYITADFNFMTMAYVTLNFMDENAYRALENNDPERVAGLSVAPVSKNTYGPLEVGIGTNRNPVLVYNSSTQAKSYLGISFANKAEGRIKNLTRLDVLIPKGVELVDCDSGIAFVKKEPTDSEMTAYFDNFTLAQESVEFLSKKLNAESDYGQTSQYVAQNLRCFLEFKSEEIFAGKSRLDPVQLNIFAFADYDYQVEDITTIAVERDDVGSSVRVNPSIVGVNTDFECKALKTTGNEFTSGKFTLKYRTAGDTESTVVEGFNDISVSCPGEFCVTRINIPELPIASSIGVGDYLTCQFTINRENDDEITTATKLVKILNTPPVVEDVYFSPESPAANQNLKCFAEIRDEEKDNLNPVQFKFRIFGTQKVRDGLCEDVVAETGTRLCSATLEHTEFKENDLVECAVYAFDGTDSNDDEGRISTTIGPDSADVTDVELRVCSDSDSGKVFDVRGTTSGELESGDATIEQDTCDSETLLKEYYCDDENIVRSLTYACSCINGECYS